VAHFLADDSISANGEQVLNDGGWMIQAPSLSQPDANVRAYLSSGALEIMFTVS
jgi:hypothetical protein